MSAGADIFVERMASSLDDATPDELAQYWAPQRYSPRIGGRFDTVVKALRLLLPAIAIVIAVTVILYPFISAEETSFVLARDSIATSEDRLRMVNPRYSGVDSDQRPFRIRAASAVQPRGVLDEVTLSDISAVMTVADNEDVRVAAARGTYTPSNEQLLLKGPVKMTTSSGYQIDARDAQVDLDDHFVSSDEAVDAAGPLGRFKSNGFRARIDEDKLSFIGGVKARITPNAAKLPLKGPMKDEGLSQ